MGCSQVPHLVSSIGTSYNYCNPPNRYHTNSTRLFNVSAHFKFFHRQLLRALNQDHGLPKALYNRVGHSFGQPNNSELLLFFFVHENRRWSTLELLL